MLGYLCRALLKEESATHLQNGETGIRAVIKYFCKKGIPPNGIHEDFMETFGKEYPSLSLRRGERECLG